MKAQIKKMTTKQYQTFYIVYLENKQYLRKSLLCATKLEKQLNEKEIIFEGEKK